MYEKSPAYYRMLSCNFAGPKRTTVTNILHPIPCSTGPTDIVFKKLHRVKDDMPDKEKYCILMWDEVELMWQIQYDKSKDSITGFEDWKFRRQARFADHAIVFMLRGINSGWKITIFHGFCDGATSQADITRCLEILVPKVEHAGFHIVATVCDQFSINLAVLKKFINKRDARLGNSAQNSDRK